MSFPELPLTLRLSLAGWGMGLWIVGLAFGWLLNDIVKQWRKEGDGE